MLEVAAIGVNLQKSAIFDVHILREGYEEEELHIPVLSTAQISSLIYVKRSPIKTVSLLAKEGGEVPCFASIFILFLIA